MTYDMWKGFSSDVNRLMLMERCEYQQSDFQSFRLFICLDFDVYLLSSWVYIEYMILCSPHRLRVNLFEFCLPKNAGGKEFEVMNKYRFGSLNIFNF